MKELAYLMFFIGCGYALNLLVITLTDKTYRKIYIRYPSSSQFNLLWGFLFYAGFACLITTSPYLKIASAIFILSLSLTLAHNYLILQSLKKAGRGIYTKILQNKFSHQQLEDKNHNLAYSQAEILTILGLDKNSINNYKLLSSRLQIYEQIAKNPKFTYAAEFYQKIRTTLEAK